MSKKPLDLQAVREKLASSSGQQYWRSLEQLANTEEFQDFMDREFPRHASEMRDPITRRNFLKLAGASLALAGLTGCSIRHPRGKIVPYVRLPEQIIPGKPLFFATAHPFGGYGQGVLAESDEGRPTKVDGNGLHPATPGGASDIYMQASILNMYDPDRSQSVLNSGQPSTWENFVAAAAQALAQSGGGLRLLTGTITSPTLAQQIQGLLDQYPQARWYVYEPVGREGVQGGAQQAFGSNINTVYRFDRANVVLSLDSDFMAYGPANVRYQRDFFSRRAIRSADANVTMNRLYVVEPLLTVTGSNADHRLPLKASQVADVARAIATAIGVQGVAPANLPESANAFVQAVVRDLQANRGTSIVIPGEGQPAAVHALAHAINAVLGNDGSEGTVVYTEPVEVLPEQAGTLQDLVNEMNAGAVQLLVMMDSNPVYAAPADLDFATALTKVPTSVHYGMHVDETAEKSTWHLPSTHFLEMWGDIRAFDGTTTIMQPLIAPLYGSRSPYELISALSGQNQSGFDIVRGFWQSQNGGANFEAFWEQALNDGIVPETTAAGTTPTVQTNFDAQAAQAAAVADSLELVFQADSKIFDGSYANNGWLHELPTTNSKISWDNVAYVSPRTAEARGLQRGDIIEITTNGRRVNAPVWIMPGQADNTIGVQLGYGRTRVGRVGNNVGYNAYSIRSFASPWFATDVQINKVGSGYDIACTQDQASLEGRDIVRTATLEEYRQDPNKFLHHEHEAYTLYPERVYSEYAWGMAIDLNICSGCNACVIACQSENNIPVVGKSEVLRGREMHWIRIDRYFGGPNIDNPEVMHMPMACQHCENAPCEVVCPVGATVHDSEGLNNMVYNRCVGTKYCSNNCPFKVRRFNFLQYNDMLYKWEDTSLKLMRNPNVTVRVKGVMEKCTYCVQRIAEVRQDKERLGEPIRDGEVVTACQNACPTTAITFGDINDATSQVAQLRRLPLSYTLLNELNVKPRTNYLAQIKNPNPELNA